MMKRRRKENYGFNEFNSVKFISIFMMSISISILLLSIGFSSFNKNLVMSNAKVMVRADKDVRISGIKVKGKVKTYSNGEVVYFNVDTGKLCSNYTESQSNTGVNSGCMKFYAFNDDGGDTVNLILDHNTTAGVAWNSSEINASGPNEVLTQLKKDTSSWQGTITPSNYTMDQTGQTSNAKYTIDYSEYKARLITANEIAKITGNTSFDEKTTTDDVIYFDTNTTTESDTCKEGDTSGCLYGWLYDRISISCTKYGCLNNSDQDTNGYWTASSFSNVSRFAWNVLYRLIFPYYIDDYGGPGVRPVITVAKDKLVNEGLSGAISNNEEYLDSSIYGDITLPTSDSTITYEVEVTNLGNVKVAIADITNEESRLAYELEEYTLGDTICDTNNNCINGIKKKIYVTLKYKDGVTPTTSSIPFNLKFDFEQVYTVTYDGITCDECKTEALGNSPFTVTISMLNPKVIMNERELTSSEYSYVNGVLTINNVDGDIIIKEGPKIYKNGEIVYFNVTTGNVCTSSDYVETQSNTGVKEGCMKFYAFNDDGGDTVNLILDHNTTATVAWVSKADYVAAGGTESDYGSYGKNDKGPITLLAQLKTDTSSWVGTETPSNYTMDQTGETSNAKYTIDYSGYKARLITAQEIATITDYSGWDEKVAANSSYYYFDSKTSTASTTCKKGNTSGCQYGWLYDRTSKNCRTDGCLNNSDQTILGYWTASSCAANSYLAWFVIYHGYVNNLNVISSGYYGVRPVITILKSKLVVKDYNVTTNLTNVNGDSSNATSITNIETKILKFIANSGYTLPEKVTVTGATYTWNKATGELTLSEVNGDIIVTIVGEEIKTYKNGEIVYFDVTTGTKCSNYAETQSNTGTKSGCMKFYAFNDDGKDTVNLILDHNTTALVAWVSKADYVATGGTESDYGDNGKNDKGPLTLLKQLKKDTDEWKGTITPLNYTMDQTGQTSNAKYTIDYSSYKARLITAQEMAKITENTSWNESTATSDFYFDTNTTTASDTCKYGNTTGCKYGWLYDRTNKECTTFGCLNNSDQRTYGYWTASSRAANFSDSWYVYLGSGVGHGHVNNDYNVGVRPVITVSKSNLS